MNLLAPVTTIMTKEVLTVNEKDSLVKVKEIFENNNFHHIPVVSGRKIVGLISKTDFLHFMRGFTKNDEDRYVNESRLKVYRAEEIMTSGLAKVEATDRVNVVLEVFKENLFHALPVVDGEELVGIITTFDIIRAVADEPVEKKY